MISFIADEHIPFASIRLLREAGYKVVSVSEEHASMPDVEILRFADQENLVIITNDSDFGDLIFRDKVEFRSGVIYFRLNRFRPEEMAHLIIGNTREHAAEFGRRFTSISRTKFRQRPL